MGAGSALRFGAALVACAALAGCYTTRSLESPLESGASEMEVRAEIRRSSTGRKTAGRDTLRGRIVRVTEDTLALAVREEERPSLLDTLRIPREDVLRLQRRVLQPARTAGLVAGTAAVVGGLGAYLLQGRGSDAGSDVGPLGAEGLLLPAFYDP